MLKVKKHLSCSGHALIVHLSTFQINLHPVRLLTLEDFPPKLSVGHLLYLPTKHGCCQQTIRCKQAISLDKPKAFAHNVWIKHGVRSTLICFYWKHFSYGFMREGS